MYRNLSGNMCQIYVALPYRVILPLLTEIASSHASYCEIKRVLMYKLTTQLQLNIIGYYFTAFYNIVLQFYMPNIEIHANNTFEMRSYHGFFPTFFKLLKIS
uniref:Uncharacterized protein n=1 Tax=Cacopsylla melanoneura TaxID=428564 RepID=A0A8D8RF58_9HEMI